MDLKGYKMFIAPSKSTKSKICIVCGDRFETTHANTICCSDKCKRDRKIELVKTNKRKPQKSTYKKRPQTKRICAVCEEEFMSSHYSKRTCGPKCARKLQDKTTRAIQSKMRKSTGNGAGEEATIKGKVSQRFLVRGKICYQGLTI